MLEPVCGVDTSQLPDMIKDKWKTTRSHRDWQVAQCWPSTMTTANRADPERGARECNVIDI